MDDRAELYWIPLGAGQHVVRLSGRLYEAGMATVQRRPRCALYHSALVVWRAGERIVVEMTPVPGGRDPADRGVVAGGAVGSAVLGRWRLFRYEVRRWPGGEIPDLGFAVGDPVCVTRDGDAVDGLLEQVARVPTPVWGRDELRAGEMWNSNSVTSWALARAGLIDAAGGPPPGGRAPGWDAGLRIAARRMA